MVCKKINFYDALDGQLISVAVHSGADPDLQGNQSVLVGLVVDCGYSISSAYMPRQQVQSLIEALKEALDEE